MPSTYTNNLGIQKPGTGEQSGSWGDTVNANSDIIDVAVNGVLSLSLTGTASTLTTSDGVVSNGQYKVLVLTGTPSGTHTITISPNDSQKNYLVYNTTAQSVVFTQGSGGNVTILAGDSSIIYANGAGATAAVVSLADHLAMSSVRITGGVITGITDLAVADGGTGASDAPTARTNLGLGTMATQNSGTVSITGGSITGITDLAVADGGTGASDAPTARTNLGLGTMATQNSGSVSITGGSITGITDLAIADGGTGASDAATARTNLGLGSMATQNSGTVSITGGSITGITDLAVADGGTGASDALTARSNLGVAIGTNVQAYDAGLQSISGLTTAADTTIYTTALDTYATTPLTAFGRSLIDDASASAARTTLGVTIGTDVQAYDAGLQSISGLVTAADRTIYTTALDTYAVTTLTAFGRSLIDDADAATGRTTLGLGTMSTQNSTSISVTGGSISGTSVSATTLSASSTTTLSGQVGLGGANYGTSGQVFTSQGAGAAPAWTTLTSIPSGIIAIWSGSQASIPSGWVICDGLNGTPDLRDRFVVGAGTSYAVAATGGQNAITSVPSHSHGVGTLANASDGAHTHNGTTSNTGSHTHGVPVIPGGAINPGGGASPANQSANVTSTSAGAHSHTFTTDSGGAHTHAITGSTASTGVASVDTRPPYYALCYIMKV